MTSDPAERQNAPIETIGTLPLNWLFWMTVLVAEDVRTGVKGIEPSFGYSPRKIERVLYIS
jgi:hypothetical protein